jgi:hypothetical protein
MNFCWTGVSFIFVVSVISVFTEFTDIQADCQARSPSASSGPGHSLAAAGLSINNQQSKIAKSPKDGL